MKRTIFSLAIAIGFSSFAVAGDVKITNNSDWTLTHLFVSHVDSKEWGEDQLGEQIVATGDSFTLTGVPCATYDVKLRDEDGDECVVSAVDICGNGGWKIESDDLLACQAETAK